MFKSQIERGAKLLDEKLPDWFWRVNVQKLKLSWCQSCVVGQLFAAKCIYDFDIACGSLGLIGHSVTDPHSFADHGFSLPPPFKVGWETLTAEWKQYILQRREAAQVETKQLINV